MKGKSDSRKQKRNLGKSIVSTIDTVALPEGYFSLIVLSEKYGYAKDYIGWLSRTGRIEAIRYGKYGQWHASENSKKDYISSLASASEQRYSAQSAQQKISFGNKQKFSVKLIELSI